MNDFVGYTAHKKIFNARVTFSTDHNRIIPTCFRFFQDITGNSFSFFSDQGFYIPGWETSLYKSILCIF